MRPRQTARGSDAGSPRRRLARASLAVGSAALALALIEGALALAGVAPPPGADSDLEVVLSPGGTLQLRAFGRYRTAIHPHKAAGVSRTVLVGDSTVYGYHVRPHGTLARFLGALLPDALGGEHEVVALAAPGLASGELQALVDVALAHLAPDLVVVYSGNNEMRPRAVDARGRDVEAAWRAPLRQLRLYRWLRGAGDPDAHGDAGGDALAETLGADWLVPRTDGPAFGEGLVLRERSRLMPWRPALLDAYERALDAMADACARAGVPLLLCVPLANGREYGPIAPACSVPLAPDARRALALDLLAVRRRIDAGALDEADAALDAIAAVDPRVPPLLAARGQLAWARGDVARARRWDRLALGLDDRPRVAAHDVVERLRALASRRGVPLADARAAFERVPAAHEPSLFVDHCHPSTYGQYTLALEIARAVTAHALLPRGAGEVAPLPTYTEACDALGIPSDRRRDEPGLRAAGDLVYALEAYDGARYRDRARAALRAVPDWDRAATAVISADLVLALLEDDHRRARARAAQLEARDRDELERVFRSLRLQPMLEAAGLAARLPATAAKGAKGEDGGG